MNKKGLKTLKDSDNHKQLDVDTDRYRIQVLYSTGSTGCWYVFVNETCVKEGEKTVIGGLLQEDMLRDM